MFPSFYLLGIKISTYSLMVFLGFVAFLVTLTVTIKIEKIRRQTANRIIFISVLGFIVLALSALIFNSLFHTIEKGVIVIGGITWLGGVIGAFPFMVFMLHKFVPKAKGNALYYFSLIVPGIVIGHAFGRIGCFLGGCCYGGVTDSVFGVVFPAGSAAAVQYPAEDGNSLPVWPTQLFEAVFELILFIVMMAARRKIKKYNIEIYCIAYGVFRFLIEFLRGDDRGATGFFLSPSQIMSLILLIAATLLILYRHGIVFKKLAAKCVDWRKEAEEYDDTIKHTPKSAAAQPSPADAIRQLHALKEQGLISAEEYEIKKQEILKRM